MVLAGRVAALRSGLDQSVGRRDSLRSRFDRAVAEVKRLEVEEELTEHAAGLVRTLIDNEITSGVKSVEELLTEGLHAVFTDQDLSVRADVDVQRGKVSVDFTTVQKQADGTVTEGLSRESFGGAVTTVQSILLRLFVTLRRELRPILLLDETLPAFDGNYIHNMGGFLHTLCERLGVDILLVCHHQPAMEEVANHAYRISKVDGVASFKKLR